MPKPRSDKDGVPVFKIEPYGAVTTLAECPPGWFCFQGRLFLKSRYRSPSQGFLRSDAYCDSGEYFWGQASSSEERERFLVQPCRLGKREKP